jgi:hypothetical protein
VLKPAATSSIRLNSASSFMSSPSAAASGRLATAASFLKSQSIQRMMQQFKVLQRPLRVRKTCKGRCNVPGESARIGCGFYTVGGRCNMWQRKKKTRPHLPGKVRLRDNEPLTNRKGAFWLPGTKAVKNRQCRHRKSTAANLVSNRYVRNECLYQIDFIDTFLLCLIGSKSLYG